MLFMTVDVDCRFPVFIYHTPNGFDMYGMPSHVNSYFKIGIDSGGNSVTPCTRSFVPDPVREKYCVEWAKHFIPQVIVVNINKCTSTFNI